MADRYRMNGSAAYDIYAEPLSTNHAAQPLRQPERLPDAKAAPRPARKVKAQMAISPLTILGTAAAAVMLLLVVFSYVRVYEAKSEVADMKNELQLLNEEQARLQSQYDSALDLEAVEKRAKELNMRQAGPSQIVYVQVDTKDTAEVYTAPRERNIFERAYDAMRSAFSDAVEYFS